MLVSEVISTIRSSIKEHSDNSLYEDELLLNFFLNQRAVILRQKIAKYNHVSPQNYTTFCIGLEEGLSHECGCITVGCKVFRSTYKLPPYLSGRNRSMLEFYTLSYKKIDLVDETDITSISHSRIKKTRPHIIVPNNNIVLFEKEYEAIMVRAILENPIEIKNIQHCQDSSNCFDVYSEDIFADRDVCQTAIELVVTKDLRLPMSISSDMNADSNPEIKA